MFGNEIREAGGKEGKSSHGKLGGLSVEKEVCLTVSNAAKRSTKKGLRLLIAFGDMICSYQGGISLGCGVGIILGRVVKCVGSEDLE